MARERVAREKAKKRLQNARQRVDRQYPFTLTWVVMEDIVDEVKGWNLPNLKEVERKAQQIWTDVCFSLEICQTGDKRSTRAEFMQEWLQAGYRWGKCKAHLKRIRFNEDRKRELPEGFKESATKRLRESVAQSYTPGRAKQARDRAEAGGYPS